MTDESPLKNPHLDGSPFFWEVSPVGILLVHGFTATTAEVRPLASFLHQAGYTISAPLLPGHYSHPSDLNRVHFQQWIDCVEQAYQELARRCDTLIVGGESTGGLLTLYLAARHPEIAAVLSYAPALQLTLSRLDRLRLRLAAPFVAYSPKANLDDGTDWQGYKVNPLRGVLQFFKLQRFVRDQLARIHQPVMIIQGRQDPTVHPGVPAQIAAAVSSSQIHIHWLENSAHVVILDREFDALAALTLDFIQHILAQR